MLGRQGKGGAMVGAHGDGRDEQEEVDYSDEENYQDYLRAEEERRWQDMDFYGILELSPSASPEEIKEKVEGAKDWHPLLSGYTSRRREE